MRTLALLFLVAATPALAARATAVTRDEVKVGSRPVIAVDSDGGGVELTAGPAGVVRVEAERHADSEDEARRLDVRVQLDGNTVRVQFRQPRPHRDASVQLRISAPGDARLDVHTGGGAVAARGFSGGIEVETGGGAVAVSEASGSLRVRTGGGAIDVRRLRGTVDVVTGGGSVHVEGALGGTNRIETGGGSIDVAIPADSKLRVDASTGGGRAHNEFGLAGAGREHWGPDRFSGTLGDGSGGTLELHTGGGSIHLGRAG